MDLLWIVIGAAALFLLNKLVLAPIRKLAFNVIVGLIVLYGVNTVGDVIGLAHIPITAITGFVIGIFGLPGVLLATLYYTFF